MNCPPVYGLTDTLWGYSVHFVTMKHKTLHLLSVLAFVFVNVVCPCVSASMLPADAGEHGQHQHHETPAEAPAVADCLHSECPDCSSAVGLSCETQILVPGSVVKTDLDDDAPLLLTGVPAPLIKPQLQATGPPDHVGWFAAVSPVSRFDLQLK